MTKQKTITIVAFGDSITEAVRQELKNRWPEIVRRTLQEQFPSIEINLINAGVGGNTSREGLARIQEDVLKHQPDIIIFEFGNDQTPDPERHVSLTEYKENTHRIITLVAQKNRGKSILMTFPPVIDSWHCNYEHPAFKDNGGQDACQETYRQVTRQVAQECSLPLIDLDLAVRAEMESQGQESCILPDGVHLTDHANHA
ncbi:MAG: hypothetical protein JKX85_07355 [Phycisphaeraceae bacterium]|nr:hypothetical protein [Phycisphaeraceae bacterium]